MATINLNDTISAIATALGACGIGVIRISGKDALKVADKIFMPSDGKKPSDFTTHTVHHGWIMQNYQVTRLPGYQKKENNLSTIDHRPSTHIVDEALLTVMRAPKSYTGEDCVEISCHGSIVGLRAVLELTLESGCRLASPGEFTKRAFLNGKMDLAQAEAVSDIIKAKTDAALKLSLQQLKGELSFKINQFRAAILDVLSGLEVKIDFPEEETKESDFKEIRNKLSQVNENMAGLLSTAKNGKILREGINAVICGKPNVGKSSLLNALLREERSIVTPIAGTTRDTVEESIDIQGIPLKIVDTAGIIEPRDLIEKKAFGRTQKYIAAADLLILLFDGSRKLTRDDASLIRKLKSRNVIAVINKIDLRLKIEKPRLNKIFAQVIEISAKKSQHIDKLEQAIVQSVYQGKVESDQSVWMSNLRHIRSLKGAQKLIARALISMDNKLSLEFWAQDLKDALGFLDDILGKRFSQDLLDKIFGEFCIGK